jgi:hypothetical protein
MNGRQMALTRLNVRQEQSAKGGLKNKRLKADRDERSPLTVIAGYDAVALGEEVPVTLTEHWAG